MKLNVNAAASETKTNGTVNKTKCSNSNETKCNSLCETKVKDALDAELYEEGYSLEMPMSH